MDRREFMKVAGAISVVAASSVMAVDTASVDKKFKGIELAYMSATEQIKLFKAGKLTPLEVLDAQLERIAQFNGEVNQNKEIKADYLGINKDKVNGISFENFKVARELAIKAAQRYKNGTARPLEGITMGVKNDVSAKGWITDQGSILLKDSPAASSDEAMVKSLRDAGAIFVFQTTTPELCLSAVTWSKLYGVTRNPWNLYYATGGSSGGSAASLAAGFCTLATGSDVGGSIRIPASQNGIYGYRPSFGRIPCVEFSYVSYGPLARTFDDMVLMGDVMIAPSPMVHTSLKPKLDLPKSYEGIKGKKIAALHFDKWTPEGTDKDTKKALNDTKKMLQKAGAVVEDISFLWEAKDVLEIFFRGLMTQDKLPEIKDESVLTPYMKKLVDLQKTLSINDQAILTELTGKLHAEVQERVFEAGYDAIITPVTTTNYIPADLGATKDALAVSNGKKMNKEHFFLTPIWNILNRYPVVVVPVGFNAKKVPVGMQVVANTYEDLEALRVAAALSKEAPKLYTGKLMPDFRNKK